MGRTIPQNCPFPLLSDLDFHLIHGLLGPWETAHRPHLDQFSRFFRPQERGQQTDKHTYRPRYSVCSSRLHMASAAILLMLSMLHLKPMSVAYINFSVTVLWQFHAADTSNVIQNR